MRGALASRGPSESRCRLSARCLEKLAGYLEQGPAEHGWVEDQVWAAARVATLIGRKFHVSYSVSGATKLMHRLGFSPQVPARRVAEPDGQAVTVWKEETWDEVKEPGRLSVAGLLAIRPGSLTRLCHRLSTHPSGKGKRRSMSERDFIALIDGAHQLVKAPLVLA